MAGFRKKTPQESCQNEHCVKTDLKGHIQDFKGQKSSSKNKAGVLLIPIQLYKKLSYSFFIDCFQALKKRP